MEIATYVTGAALGWAIGLFAYVLLLAVLGSAGAIAWNSARRICKARARW